MRPRLLLVLLSLAAALASPALVLAHAELRSADPGPGDEVVGSPTEIVANFTQDLDLSRTTLEVRNAAGETLAEGAVRGEGPRQIVLALPELAPGVYEVRWTSFSAEDGELERGRYSFTVLPAPTPTPAPTVGPSVVATAPAGSVAPTVQPSSTPTATVAPAPPDDGGVVALLPIGVAAVVLLTVGAFLLRRR